jgi:hypothetical protein
MPMIGKLAARCRRPVDPTIALNAQIEVLKTTVSQLTASLDNAGGER